MQYIFTLRGEVPSKKNSRIATKSGRNYPSKEYQEWHERAAREILTQERPKEPLKKCKRITMCFNHADKKRRDTNNQMASLFDLLVDCKVLKDDCWTITGIEAGFGKLSDEGDGAWCWVVIEEGE